MNKKIWMTGALSIAAIFITVFVYNNFIMDKDAVAAEKAAAEAAVIAAEPPAYKFEPAEYKSLTESGKNTLNYSNDIFTVVFSSDDGVPVSFQLNHYKVADGGNVDLIFSGDTGIYPFSIHDGNFEANEISGFFKGALIGDDVVFTGLFTDDQGNKFEIIKTWSFVPGSYMIGFQLDITPIIGELPLGDTDFVYSLGFGPQIGPEVEKFSRGYVYRYFCLLDGDEKRNVATPEEDLTLVLDEPYKWVGMEGRYFAVAVIPSIGDYVPAWDERRAEGIFKRSSFYIQRPAVESAVEGSSGLSDQYYVYFGPKDEAVLDSFDSPEENAFGLNGIELGLIAGEGGIVSALSKIVKTLLNILNKIIPNYGLDIVVFALFIQVLIFPISRRTYDNAIRMQLLGPQIGELKKKFKYNDKKMNDATIKLFEDNNVKPRSSMAPFVIHLPFFILTYVLLLTNIDFRLEVFIPGWINDISVPEYIFDFSPAVMPITGWDKIRILPIIVLAVSLIQSRYIQAPAESIRSMKVMSYLIPIVMFLVIYNMPSGAVLYWLTMTATNLLLQWRIKNRYAAKE